MRPLLQHAQRSFSSNASLVASKPPSRTFSSILRSVSSVPSVCLQCQYRASVAIRSDAFPQWKPRAFNRRSLHQPSSGDQPKDNETPEERLARVRADIALREKQEKERLEKERQEKERLERERQEKERQERERQEKERLEWERLEKQKQATPEKKPLPNVIELPSSRSSPAKAQSNSLPDAAELSSSDTVASPNKDAGRKVEAAEHTKREQANNDVERVPEDQLPSHHHARRWNLSNRFQQLMDDVLPKLAVVTQKVNTYTGTDYSGIEALKREIKEHENLVRTRRALIEEAKQSLDTALSQQGSAQKEVVALLERKHSWSDRDLERYMSLIRSEHINDQAVREAKEAIKQAENSLEEARSQLEKRERAQYHEEQIWSDTIRRNSTWVTFGLMGLNIFLLLATMIIIEPWRRRRMVREIKTALEAQKTATEAVTATPAAITPAIPTEVEVKEVSAEAIPASAITADMVDTAPPAQQEAQAIAEAAVTTDASPTMPELPGELSGDLPTGFSAAPIPNEKDIPLESITTEEGVRGSPAPAAQTWQERVTYVAKDIISERTISMRRIDYTAAILQGACAGAIITAAVVAMIVGR
ncbi:hypothetical protein BU23DRAFT_519918 [Bimuria novae-zelandiae CBS 107.79]|uniref:Sensitive to high expression protein 9, mitochondrial n=1 Tax=Bimuria novae-zelandiae CBS 107.79 TaxID=1447943 RepID=A0A6A5UKP2_9PLEO|nr:hypothetical protein BU23DRAFT_519918 [Bimuria novae-zelandiae CBS 107.79]